jgi:tRNA pseudouridine38-40 synthase
VQGVLEEAVRQATGEASRVAFAGRTDAGVHARGQVASFLTASRHTADVMQRALNAWLPDDVAVICATETPIEFDPRRDAVRRRYRYVIENRPARPALDRERAWHVPGDLDVEAMSAAAQAVLGRHDFAAFASRLERPGASAIRTLFRFDVRRLDARVCCDLTANAFLPHQVRRMVGALVEAGKGRLGREDYARLLEGSPASAGPAAPAHGLYLMHVEYAPPLFAALDSEMAVC